MIFLFLTKRPPPTLTLFPYTTLFRSAASPSASATSNEHDCRPSEDLRGLAEDRKSTRLNSSHGYNSYAVFCLKKKKSADETFLVLQRSSIVKHDGDDQRTTRKRWCAR